jgi:small subunit ribosomal protein S8
MGCEEDGRGKKVNGEPGTASKISEPGAESLPAVRALARIYAPVQTVPHLFPPRSFGRQHSRRDQIKLVSRTGSTDVDRSRISRQPFCKEQGLMTNDPIADMLARLSNAAAVRHQQVMMPASKLRVAVAKILKDEGYIEKLEVTKDKPQPMLRLWLRYDDRRKPILSGVKRISKPGRRVYAGKTDVPWVQQGMGIAIVSTTQGVMTGARAKRMGLGGEVLCFVW